MERRFFIQGVLAGGTACIVASLDCLEVVRSASATVPENVFAAESESEVIKVLFGDMQIMKSDAINLTLPLMVSLGKGIKVEVSSNLKDVEVIALVTEKNQHPLNTFVKLNGADAFFNTRIRVEQTSPVTAYVKAGGRLYSSSKIVKVRTAGYGNHISQVLYASGGGA